jgi:hypothetical protein
MKAATKIIYSLAIALVSVCTRNVPAAENATPLPIPTIDFMATDI